VFALKGFDNANECGRSFFAVRLLTIDLPWRLGFEPTSSSNVTAVLVLVACGNPLG
jgi:hypothetical protein